MYPHGKEVVTLPETPTGTGEKKGKKFTLCEYKMEFGKPYSQIVFIYALHQNGRKHLRTAVKLQVLLNLKIKLSQFLFFKMQMVMLMMTHWMIFSLMILVWII